MTKVAWVAWLLTWLLPGMGCTALSITGPGGDSAGLGDPFTLAPGESVRVRGTLLDVGFVGVSGDSRCPADVVCVWEGDAAVEVETELAGERLSHTLHTSGRIGPAAVERGGYRVALEDLRPYPVSEGPIQASSYRATLVVTRLD